MELVWKVEFPDTPMTIWELYPTEEFVHNHRTYHPGDMVGWISRRPNYCDRGHWQGQTELGGMDIHDCWPNMYMSLERAKLELEEFTRWRVLKERSPNEHEEVKS